jgi:hypothetical protein
MTRRAGLMAVIVAAAALGAATGGAGEPTYLGPDGAPLPFRDAGDALEFLRTARIVSDERTPGGINGARKVLLERDGLRGHAVFRAVAIEKLLERFGGGRIEPFFRDHYVNEVAAFELSEMLGLHTVPPTVLRHWRRQDGSLQLWIEGVLSDEEVRDRGKLPLWNVKRGMQLATMQLFDLLINNTDRNRGNYLTDGTGRIWFVDHTRTFSRVEQLAKPAFEIAAPREMWARLRELPDAEIEGGLRDYLPAWEIEALLERRRRLLERIEEAVGDAPARGTRLFSLEYALSPTPLPLVADAR